MTNPTNLTKGAPVETFSPRLTMFRPFFFFFAHHHIVLINWFSHGIFAVLRQVSLSSFYSFHPVALPSVLF